MRKLLMAAAGAVAFLGVSASAQAAPISGGALKPMVLHEGIQAEQVHWRSWRHCHRRCGWRHGRHRCWNVCHGGRHRW